MGSVETPSGTSAWPGALLTLKIAAVLEFAPVVATLTFKAFDGVTSHLLEFMSCVELASVLAYGWALILGGIVILTTGDVKLRGVIACAIALVGGATAGVIGASFLYGSVFVSPAAGLI